MDNDMDWQLEGQSADNDAELDFMRKLGLVQDTTRRGQRSNEPEPDRESEFQELIRHWMNERHAPDILASRDELLGRILDHIRRQTATVQLLLSEPSSSEDEHFRIMLAQTEVERVKFVVRSYVRTRLFKIEKYARYIMSNVEVQSRLSEIELEHARRHAKLNDYHFNNTVLQGLPFNQRGLDDDIPMIIPSMITAPDKNRAVFVHARTQCPRVTLPDGTTLEMEKGHISLMPFYVAEQLVARGEAELV